MNDTPLNKTKKSSIYNIRSTNKKSENRSREIKIVVVPNLDSNVIVLYKSTRSLSFTILLCTVFYVINGRR